MTDDDATIIKIQTARIEERLSAMQDAAEHRHTNLKLSIEGMATKKEVETVNEKLASTKGDLSARIAQLESNQARVVWALLGTAATVVANVLGLTSKKFGF